MLIDAHSHLNLYFYKRFRTNLDNVLNQINKNNILTITTSMDVAAYRKNLEISKKSKLIIPAFGIHPWNASKYINKIDLLKKIINGNSIIGEIGLDYFFVKDKSKYRLQRKIFEVFLKETKNKIISVHTKGSEKDVLRMLKKYKNRKVIIHWYSGDIVTLKDMVKEGYYFSIGPAILISKNIQDIVNYIPLKQMLTETDNPDGPESIMRKVGMPVLIKDVIKKMHL